MNLLRLSASYIRQSGLASALNLVLLILGVGTIALLLILGRELESRLTRDAQGIDLVVGAKGSPLQLVLAGVFHVDTPTGNIPSHFEAVAKLVTEDEVAEPITCGPDPKKHLAAIRKYVAAGYDHICVHQVGKEQKGFFEFYEQEILPELKSIHPGRRGAGRMRRRRRAR